ncbi:MAG: bifunctional phosphoribosylaminoimidazolecarboxamide formyltransferase/IMP cyclohydrolase [Sphaerochaetaceae bacterium]
MNTKPTPIKTALLSVSDKRDLIKLAKVLDLLSVKIISTGGTAKELEKASIKHTPISDYTNFPEIMEGRVKTLHPKVAASILGLRDRHQQEAQQHSLEWIDLIVCNLYPFEQTIAQKGVSADDAISQIDIGGPTMIRAGAKNYQWVSVVTSPDDYDLIINQLTENGSIDYKTRRFLATKAFSHTAYYDAIIANYFNTELFPNELSLTYSVFNKELRYGENPHQKGAVYRGIKKDPFSLLDCKVLQGKELSFNNLGDAYGAINALREFSQYATVVVKHATICGIAEKDNIFSSLKEAFEADSLSAFGSIIALNAPCDRECAAYLSDKFIEILSAPSFTEEALQILAKKKNLRLIETGVLPKPFNTTVGKFIGDDLLLQEKDNSVIKASDLKVVTKRAPNEKELEDLLFAFKAAKFVKSNAIVTVYNKTTCGIGGGQVSRVDATKIALSKSSDHPYLVLASDAFFPFRDSIDGLKGSNVTAIIQPGGSIRDKEVIEACDEANIAMVFSSIRTFFHS